MAHELLRYRPVDDLYEDWLDHIAELVSAAGGSPAPSLSLPRPPPATGDVAHKAPPPLCPKTAPWSLGARLHDATRCVTCPRVKKEAVKKSLDRKKTLRRSSHRRSRTGYCGKTMRHL